MKVVSRMMEIDVFDLTSWPNGFRWGVALSMIAVVGICGTWLLTLPINAQLESARVQQQNLENAIALESQFAEKLPNQRSQMASTKRRLAKVVSIFNGAPLLSSRLSDLSAIAVDLGIELEQFKPGPQFESERFRVELVQVTLTGQYLQFRNFIDRVLSLPGLIAVDDFSITKNELTLTMQLTLAGYQYANEIANGRHDSSGGQEKSSFETLTHQSQINAR